MNAIDYVKQNNIEKARIHLEKMKAENWHNGFYNDLKQIVDAFDNINKHGGLLRSKAYCEEFKDMGSESTLILMSHINLVEQCQK